MEITAVIKRIEETKAVGTNGFEIRNLVVTTEEQYPQILSIQFTQGKVVELDKVKVGDKVKVSVSLKGKESVNAKGETVVFNRIEGWKIESI